MEKDQLADFKGKTTLTEQEVNLLMRRINAGKIKPHEFGSIVPDGGFKLSSSQVEKGRKWLVNQWKTPKGVERKNNPFGYREQDVLENFSTIMLKDIWSERGNFYVPLYEVEGKGGGSFEYALSGGQIHILG